MAGLNDTQPSLFKAVNGLVESQTLFRKFPGLKPRVMKSNLTWRLCACEGLSGFKEQIYVALPTGCEKSAINEKSFFMNDYKYLTTKKSSRSI